MLFQNDLNKQIMQIKIRRCLMRQNASNGARVHDAIAFWPMVCIYCLKDWCLYTVLFSSGFL